MTGLITLAGDGKRFSQAGEEVPKPLLEVGGDPMIIKAVNCLPTFEKYVFVCRSEHLKKYQIDELLRIHYPNCEFVTVDETTEGQACSAQIGIEKSSIKNDDPIIISCCDYGLEWSRPKFEKVKRDADIIVWSTIRNESFASNPSSYSWLEVDGDTLLKTHVKKSVFDDPYNNHAIVGTFYFSRASDFINAAKVIYKKKIRSNGEYYIDNIFNTITELKVNMFEVDNYYCWGTPEEWNKNKNENPILG
jgi:NDP-sugar pyrophosphorylase family protein